tara:strand:+ start:850 stop:1470 length:621 start_codon:yes stop_codon:yes gene_type:complete
MEILTPKNIKSYFEAKEYKFFDTPDRRLNLNLIGVRRDNQGTNTFDDFLLVMYRDEVLMISDRYQITTDPGKYWLNNPSNPKGTAVLIPGQYRGTWQLGKHQGKYEALVQRRPVKVYRDNNKNDVIDYNNLTLLSDEGYFGINIHRSNPYDQSYVVNRWSAGCQVFKKVEDYNNFIQVCRDSADIYGNSFTYTLITEKELRNHLNS